MLTVEEKQKLVNRICGLIRESIYENGFFENGFFEKKEDDEKPKKKKHSKETDDKLDSILKWLDTAQELHSVLAYELWPDKDKDTARSEFSKKYRGHDDDGKKYSFTPEEVNTLYNMREDFINRAGFNAKK